MQHPQPTDAQRPPQPGGPGVGRVEAGDVVVEHVLGAEAADLLLEIGVIRQIPDLGKLADTRFIQ